MDIDDVPYWKLDYDARMERRRARREAEGFEARLAAMAARVEARRTAERSREIWGAIHAYDRSKAEANQLRRSPAQAKNLKR